MPRDLYPGYELQHSAPATHTPHSDTFQHHCQVHADPPGGVATKVRERGVSEDRSADHGDHSDGHVLVLQDYSDKSVFSGEEAIPLRDMSYWDREGSEASTSTTQLGCESQQRSRPSTDRQTRRPPDVRPKSRLLSDLDSTSGTDHETTARSRPRGLRKTKSRGKGKGMAGQFDIDLDLDGIGFNNDNYSSESDSEALHQPKSLSHKQCWI